uniref:ATP synthase complex subunit 8 n=1 Tax=Evandromyia infraspinosa TaxID=474172 RepID=A0A343AWB6_9DIPT|nr:ATP synthase F0 subunit 8 [Evandromyia infraspinosa]
MPQMAPLMWLSLFIFFLLMYLFFNIMNYFSYNMLNNNQSKKTFLKQQTYNWKW